MEKHLLNRWICWWPNDPFVQRSDDKSLTLPYIEKTGNRSIFKGQYSSTKWRNGTEFRYFCCLTCLVLLKGTEMKSFTWWQYLRKEHRFMPLSLLSTAFRCVDSVAGYSKKNSLQLAFLPIFLEHSCNCILLQITEQRSRISTLNITPDPWLTGPKRSHFLMWFPESKHGETRLQYPWENWFEIISEFK